MKDIGIVVLNYNNFALTQSCVDNLLSLKVNYNIVIVDNNSNNDSFSCLSSAYLKNKYVDVIQSGANKGYAYGNNCGCKYLLEKYINIKYLCIMNPDVIIEYKDIFSNLKGFLENNRSIAAITGLMYIRGKLSVNNCYWDIPKGIEIATKASIFANLKENKLENNDLQCVEVIPGSFFMIKSDIYKTIKGFDEGTFLYNEEIILAIKLKELGMYNAISTNDYYNHNHMKKTKNLAQIIEQRKISDTSNIYLCNKYYNNKYLLFLYIVIVSNYIFIPIRYFYRKIKNLLLAD